MHAPLFNDIADAPDGGSAYWVNTTDDKQIRFAVWSGGTRGTVVLFPGRTEYVEKYGRVVGRLVQRGFSCVVIDWRGQGLSTRPGGTTALGHVEEFEDYRRDWQAVFAHPAVTGLPKPRILLCHSMGGCIGLRALHSGIDVQTAIFSAPMWGIGLKPMLYVLGKIITGICLATGQDKLHAPGTTSDLYVLKQPFEGNTLTNDPETYAWLQTHLQQHPELGLGGPSMRWINRAFRETTDLLALPAPRPVLTFLGEDESVVNPQPIRDQMGKPGAGKLVPCHAAQHEILMEAGPVQTLAWSEIDAWLSQSKI